MASIAPTMSNSFGQGVQRNETLPSSASPLTLPYMNNNQSNITATTTKPGQQLLPNYAMKLLKNTKIPFGTDRTMNGVDIDPTLPLLNHIVDCFGTLRDVNKIYRSKGSLASRSVGARVLFGFTAELGNLLLDAITFNPPNELKDAAALYINIGSSILSIFPEIAAQVTKQSGKMLIHHTALKASQIMASDALKMVLKAYPAGAWTVDASGALPLHWLTHNPNCSPELITILINSNPKGPWIADNGGYLPLHWAVNQPNASIEVVASLLAANPAAASKPCLRGTLALHWCVSRDTVNIQILKALLQVYADGARTFDDEGCLPLHRLVNRANIDTEALKILVDTYPQALQCPNADGELPLHLAVDQTNPDINAIELLLESYPGALQVADDEGYLPLHATLDCSQPNVEITKLLLKRHQQAAYHRTNDGLLPLHCIISSLQPSVEIIRRLLKIYPTSSEEIAVDLVPVDEGADPETWQGDWKKMRWTPLSRAIERRLDPIVSLFKAAMVAYKQQQQDLADGVISSSPDKDHRNGNKSNGNGPSAATARALGNNANPPIHSGRENTIMVGSELDDSMDASAMANSPTRGSKSRNSRSRDRDQSYTSPKTRSRPKPIQSNPDGSNNEAIDDLLAMINSPTGEKGANATAKAFKHSPSSRHSRHSRHRSSERSERRHRSSEKTDPLEESGATQYSAMDSFISNAESNTGFDLSNASASNMSGSQLRDEDMSRRRERRRHHRSSHHSSSSHQRRSHRSSSQDVEPTSGTNGSIAEGGVVGGGSLSEGEAQSVEGDRGTGAGGSHRHHHRRSHSRSDRSSSRERSSGQNHRSSGNSHSHSHHRQEENVVNTIPLSSDTAVVPQLQEETDADIELESSDVNNRSKHRLLANGGNTSNNHTTNTTTMSKSIKEIRNNSGNNNNENGENVPIKPKPFLSTPSETTSSNVKLTKVPSSGNGQIAVDVKLPAIAIAGGGAGGNTSGSSNSSTPKNGGNKPLSKTVTSSGGYESLDELV